MIGKIEIVSERKLLIVYKLDLVLVEDDLNKPSYLTVRTA